MAIKSKSTAVDNYEAGIKRIGIDAYEDAMDCSTISCAAETLHDAKKTEGLSVRNMKSAYGDAW